MVEKIIRYGTKYKQLLKSKPNCTLCPSKTMAFVKNGKNWMSICDPCYDRAQKLKKFKNKIVFQKDITEYASQSRLTDNIYCAKTEQ